LLAAVFEGSGVDHYFVSHEKVRRYFVPVPGMDLDAVAYVERDGAVKEGTPFILVSTVTGNDDVGARSRH
jgi:hypothetical protein